VDGFVLASSNPKIFSAGLDMKEFMVPDPEHLSTFWTAVQDMWLALYGTPKATSAAIAGHAPAGGCLMALCCDHRV
jgi:3,2-trans-enoyl-CoA isomerase